MGHFVYLMAQKKPFVSFTLLKIKEIFSLLQHTRLVCLLDTLGLVEAKVSGYDQKDISCRLTFLQQGLASNCLDLPKPR